jgi:hypothetical protein
MEITERENVRLALSQLKTKCYKIYHKRLSQQKLRKRNIYHANNAYNIGS